MNHIEIKTKKIGNGCPILIIAEVASAHEGDFDNLIRLTDIAIQNGADAIKFQVLNADSHMVASHEIFDLVKKLEFSEEEWLEIVRYIRGKSDILIISDIYDEASIAVVDKMEVDLIKIHSADLNNYPLLQNAAGLQKPTLIGVGASTINEIRDSLSFYRKGYDGFVGLLHGYQAFPTRIEELNISQINTLRQYFDLPVGFLDHTKGDSDESIFVPLVAQGIGAFAIEKHITIDRSLKGIDYESALSLNNFKKMVRWLRIADKSMGNPVLQPLTGSEYRYRDFMKKNIVAAIDIQVEETITHDHIALKRSAKGLTADQIDKVIAKKARKKIAKDENITLDVLL